MKTSELVWQDTQHQELLALVDSLKKSPESGLEILHQLTDYVTHHFSLEEHYMEATDYPDVIAHIRAHRDFEDTINSLKLNRQVIEQGFSDDKFRREVTDFLTDWLASHVFGLDKELEQHILESNIK